MAPRRSKLIPSKPRHLMTQVERFYSYVDYSDADGCWLWTASTDAQGYGHYRYDGTIQYTHRIAVVLDGREIPDGETVDHLCGVRTCVRPSHLEVVSRALNGWRSRFQRLPYRENEPCPTCGRL